MGGIIGKLSFDHDETLALPALEQMLATLRHRGSAGTGFYVAPGIALGWCGGERSPITRPAVATNEDETVRVVTDSALTHTVTLRHELETSGHRVRGRSDADLIAHAYDEWGDGCVEHLRGAFACAIWDERQQRLLLARDRIGVRPLFYAVLHGHGIVFGSEIRALLQDPGVGRDWCPAAIDSYLALGYVPAPLTAYQRISKLEPAQLLVVDGRRLHLSQYWDLPQRTETSERGIEDALDATLQAASREHLANPEITAALYSGGLVSSALLAASPAGLDAVLMATGDDPAELDRATAAAKHLGAMPYIEHAQPDVAAMAQQVASHLDEPLADPRAVSHYAALIAARLRTRNALAGYGASAFWHGWTAPVLNVDPHAFTLWDDADRRGLYTRGFAWQVRDSDPFSRLRDLLAARPADDAIGRALYVAARTSLPDSRLAMVDRMSVAAGVELHLPFLDRDVIELACRLCPRPDRSRARRIDPIAAVLARRLPVALMPTTRVTRNCTAPGSTRLPWLPAALHALVPAVLLAPRFDGRGIVSRPVIRQLWEDHAAGRTDHSHRLWSLLMLEFWFREYIDGDTAVDEPFEYAILRAA